MSECLCDCADQDGKVDHIIPVCEVDKCSIQVYSVRIFNSLVFSPEFCRTVLFIVIF